jgi:hypothetical protein
MKQVVRIILAAAVVAALAVPAMAADKLVVKGTSGADGNVLRVDDTGMTEIKAAWALTGAPNTTPLLGVYNSDLIRMKVRPIGITEWYLNNGVAEAGAIKYSTPGGGAGIGFFTGATYDQNQFNFANYPTLGTGGTAALAAMGYAAGGAMIVIDKTTKNVGFGYMWNGSALGLPTNPLDIDGNSIRIRTAQTPVSTAACNAGAIAWDTGFIYVCTATGAWKRAALSAY